MPKVGPLKRRELLHYLRQLGFTGPFSGGRHQFMIKGHLRVRIPNPHQSDIGLHLLSQILREADVPRATWEAL